MRYLLFMILLIAAPAVAGQVVEVQNLKITGAPDRDTAVIMATKEAAAQVWSQLNPGQPLPPLSAGQLAELTTYVDVTNETVQPNFYAATFNLGIRTSVLTGVPEPEPDQPSAAADATTPSWVLVIPAREQAGRIQIWKSSDAWESAWMRAPSDRVTTAVAQASESDSKLLTADLVETNDPVLADRVRQLARKYTAPAVALVILRSEETELKAGQEVNVAVLYFDINSHAQTTQDSPVFIPPSAAQTPYQPVLAEAQRLLADMVQGPQMEADSLSADSVNSFTPSGQPGLSASYQAPAGPEPASLTAPESSLAVRIPLSGPADLHNYRSKINSIPGARFEISSLNRTVVEGNIVYSGSKESLLRELAQRGLPQN